MIVRKYQVKSTVYGREARKVTYTRPKYIHKNNDRLSFEAKRKESRRDDSLSRTRQKIYQLVHCNHYAHGHHPAIFLTLTFKKNITDLKQANYEYKLFIERLVTRANKKLKWLAIIEFQKRGAVHYHVVFFNLPKIPYNEIQKIWGHGMTRVEKGTSIRNLSAYIAKYLSKDIIDNRLKGHNVLKTSRHLKRPIEYEDPPLDPIPHYDTIQTATSAQRTVELKKLNKHYATN